MTRRATNTVNQMKAICWENSPLIELQIQGIMPLQKLIEKISDNEKSDLMAISEGIGETLLRLHQEMPEQIRAVTITDQFYDLKNVGQYQKLMSQAASNSDGDTPFALEEAVISLCEKGIRDLNRALESLFEKFPGNEFEPIRLD